MKNNTSFQNKLHWIIFFWPMVIFLGGVALLFYYPVFQAPALLFTVFGLLWIIVTAINYHFSSLELRDGQLILSTGLFIRQSVTIPIKKIESIDIRQPVMGSIFHYGTLIITGTGGTKYSIQHLQHPLTCRRQVEMLLGK
jgi:uncharacterized membrane protein YdbT with pleckstrin-like domain